MCQGGTVRLQRIKPVNFEKIIGKDKEAMWSLLVHTGYLTVESRNFAGYRLKIPNHEVHTLYREAFPVKANKVVIEESAIIEADEYQTIADTLPESLKNKGVGAIEKL